MEWSCIFKILPHFACSRDMENWLSVCAKARKDVESLLKRAENCLFHCSFVSVRCSLSAEIIVVSYLLMLYFSNYAGHFKKLVINADYFHVWSNVDLVFLCHILAKHFKLIWVHEPDLFKNLNWERSSWNYPGKKHSGGSSFLNYMRWEGERQDSGKNKQGKNFFGTRSRCIQREIP